MNSSISIFLASQSKYRKRLLEQNLGLLNIKTLAPLFQEEEFKHSNADLSQSPRELARSLSYHKGLSIAQLYPMDLVISGDQVCFGAGKIWDKPVTKENAKTALKALQGKTHELITSVHIFIAGKVFEHQDITCLTMKSLTDLEIEQYILFANPLDCAGSYKIETGGFGLFTKIESSDYSSIEGIPLLFVSKILKENTEIKLWT
jgi:septum formation protein